MTERTPTERGRQASSAHRRPIRLLVLGTDASLADAVAACCCALAMDVQAASDPQAAAQALTFEQAEMVLVDGQLGPDAVVGFVRRLRMELCVDWAPVLVAGDVARLRPLLREAAPGLVDHVITKPLQHEELHERLAASRRTVSLARAYGSTLDRVSEAVVVIDESGRVRSVNAVAQRLFGWEAGELRGASVNRLMPPRHRHAHDGYLARYQSTGVAHVIGRGRVEAGQRRDGSQFPMHLTVSDISDPQATRFVGVIRDLTSDREAEDLRQRAWHDALTGLPNRAQVLEQLHAACARRAQGGEGFALVYLDLDGFKPVNDGHGHAVGDEVLRTVARRLRHGLNHEDLVARMGGDEFLVLLRGVTRAAQAEGVTRRLQAAVGQPIVVDGRAVSVGASLGIAVHGLDGDTPQALLQSADQAMYAQKRRRGLARPGTGLA
ncbi:MAG: GGDEF domain-containing protein [Rubrivivax sp.]|nr:GGDEF domain-containing protein [Rubrivivax sp.]